MEISEKSVSLVFTKVVKDDGHEETHDDEGDEQMVQNEVQGNEGGYPEDSIRCVAASL